MYKRGSVQNGIPPRFYRSVEEIKRDISDILAKSFRIRELFSVRELLSTAMDEAANGRVYELYDVAAELFDAVGCAKDELEGLDRELEELKREVVGALT